jgi:hypothetical protein
MLKFFAAVRAVEKPPVDRTAAEFAQKSGFLPIRRIVAAEFIGGLVAALAHDERLAFFYPQNGNEKQIEIMVNPHLVGLVETAVRTPSGSFVYLFRFGCNTADKKEHTNSLPLGRNICNLINPPPETAPPANYEDILELKQILVSRLRRIGVRIVSACR